MNSDPKYHLNGYSTYGNQIQSTLSGNPTTSTPYDRHNHEVSCREYHNILTSPNNLSYSSDSNLDRVISTSNRTYNHIQSPSVPTVNVIKAHSRTESNGDRMYSNSVATPVNSTHTFDYNDNFYNTVDTLYPTLYNGDNHQLHSSSKYQPLVSDINSVPNYHNPYTTQKLNFVNTNKSHIPFQSAQIYTTPQVEGVNHSYQSDSRYEISGTVQHAELITPKMYAELNQEDRRGKMSVDFHTSVIVKPSNRKGKRIINAKEDMFALPSLLSLI